ncbi:MAG: DEAD/DEAH box helicase [Pseudomonadota bacterium]
MPQAPPSSPEFHPTVQAWFARSFAAPTEVQTLAWPVIAAGQHALITAPTGSGKTLTAFLWALSDFAKGVYPTGATSVLYISPLKALNNDIQRNLHGPLNELRQEGAFPDLKVRTRSGDTEQTERQRMLRKPPDILVTTPESLALMLTTRRGREALSTVRTVILDEIHSLVDNRRGAQLVTNLERLADLTQEFQRIALSATVNPLQAVADYVAGIDGRGNARKVEIVNAPGQKAIDFSVRFPEQAKSAADNGQKIWEPLSAVFKDTISANQSTLLFTNSRRLAEKITLKINEQEPQPVAYAHHGSLSRDIRFEVEQRLKAGELRAIVATNSLEMGIDIGHLDEVVLVQSPPSVSAAIQRIGRAGHRVGETSVGTLFPTHAHDMLEAAVLAEAIAARDIEPQQLMHGPLDVLTQVIIAVCATDPWPVDEVYALVCRAAPYRNLARDLFDNVIEMLAGRYQGSRIRELKPRLIYDREAGTIKAAKGALLALYSSGGNIPDRGYFQMRHLDSGAMLGELDEEFVWEATTGQVFTLGTQDWQIHRITHNDVIVRPAPPGTPAPPFWRSEFFNRPYHFSNRITEYLEDAEQLLASGASDALREALEVERGFDTSAAQELADYLERQRAHTTTPLPHRHHLLLELVKTGPAGYHGPDDPQQLVLHTFWGGQLNQPFALALRSAWRATYDHVPDIHADNNAIVILCKSEPDPEAILSLVTPQNLLDHLRAALETSGFFGARFRECAGRSLLLTKRKFNQRLPLWMSRMQAKKLLTQIKQLDDFPVLVETWRTCIDDEFDLPSLAKLLDELQSGSLEWSFVTSRSPSPFAHNLTFGQVSRYMYADDTPDDDLLSTLSQDVIGSALYNDRLRPRIQPEIIEVFTAKRQRRASGYAPADEEDWSQWLKERTLVPVEELDAPLDYHFAVRIEIGDRAWYAHREMIYGLIQAGTIPALTGDFPALPDPRDARQIALEVLSFFGPLSAEEIAALLPIVPEDLLFADSALITGTLIKDSEALVWCDAENLEILLRMQRASQRVHVDPLPARSLPGFLAALHHFDRPVNDERLLDNLELLRGYPGHPDLHLHDFPSARLTGYQTHMLDSMLADHGLQWRGMGRTRVSLGYPEDFDPPDAVTAAKIGATFTDPAASYPFQQLARAYDDGQDMAAFNELFWESIWDGAITSDSINALRQGSERNYQISSSQTRSRRRIARPHAAWSGTWMLVSEELDDDPLSALERDKDQVRLLLERYGFVCRELVNREARQPGGQAWRWRHAFRALRVMELSGEVIAGHFFEGLGTPQFAPPKILQQLRNHQPPQTWWLAAYDPAAPCGLGLDWPELNQRKLGNYLAFHADALALTVSANGKQLHYHLDPEHPAIDAVNGLLHYLVNGRRQRLTLHTINDLPARASPYLAALERGLAVSSDHRAVYLEPSF